MRAGKLPLNWPPGFEYSPVSIYRGVAANLFRHLLSSPDPQSADISIPCIADHKVHPHLEIRKITQSLQHLGKIPHPLVGQNGVFALKKIQAHTILGEYVGEIFFSQESSDTPVSFKDVHCWRATFEALTIHISSKRFANELAFTNDFRGLQSEPNTRPKWILHCGIFYFGYETIREIEPMEELLVDYGKTWETKRGVI